jgi:tRNA-modifying protein YgfZ
MSTDAAPLSGRLAYLGILRFTGPDALGFLQGQVSADTRRLSNGESLLTSCSSAQGRVLALIYLLPHSSGIAAILPREILAQTMAHLRKFVLRAKVHIEDAGDALSVAGHHGQEALLAAGLALPGAPGSYVETDGVGIAHVAHDISRFWVIGACGKLKALGLAGEDASASAERAWRLADIRAGLPQVYPATREAFVAQMLNLDLLDGISFSKGCYTGQEIITRTQHLGRIKRRLFRLRLPPGTWSVGQSLRLADGRAGRLTETEGSADLVEALAVLNVDPQDLAPTSESLVAATYLPLPYALP